MKTPFAKHSNPIKKTNTAVRQEIQLPYFVFLCKAIYFIIITVAAVAGMKHFKPVGR